jgi:outer membrane receptor protein involved in Fe transport
MKNSVVHALKSGAAPLVLGTALLAGPAMAQAAKPADDQNTIVVTGSLIKNPNIVQANPVNVTTANEIELNHSNVAEEVLREVPGIVPDIGSSVNNGNGGSSYVNLRGLGANRNVVLLDGNRIVPAGLGGVVDLNNIPLALINRVDALTGAAVTTYGADAIAGVVNFVTKKNFSGVDLSLGDEITQKGDGNYKRADLTIGSNFADGRGNAVLSLGYQNSDPVYQGDRDFSLYNVSSFSGAASGSGTTAPTRFTVPGQGTKQINPATGLLQSGFNAYNFNPFNIFQTPFKRYNMFAQANYDVTDSIEVYSRALFSKNSVDTIIAPSGVFSSSVVIPYSNPFLPAGAASQFCGANGLTTAQCTAAVAATNPANPNYKTFTTTIRRRTPETGTRNSDYTSTVFDMQMGVDGKLTDSIKWDIHGSYGQSDKLQTITGYVLTSRVRDALLATNSTTCISGNAGCVPLNIFGAVGSITPAMLGYLLSPSTTDVKTSLGQVHGQIAGDFGWKLPTAELPVSFAVGTEYRKYTAQQQSDTLAQTPGELGGAGGAAPAISGSYQVYEGFAELVAPLVQDKEFIKDLTLEGGVRYSKYKVPGGAGSETWTYKGGLTWTPVSDIKFRANYAHAVRAPNIGELFSPVSTGLTGLAVDPCAGAAPVANANLRAVCLAQGAPAASIGLIANPTASQANITTGGNINLKPETANTYTLGVVLQPRQVPHFNVSVDYYHIKVSNIIAVPTPGQLISACFGNITAASATDPNCTSIRRGPVTGQLDGDPATTFGLFGVSQNLPIGALTDGVDIIANYDHKFSWAKWSSSAVFNYTHRSSFNGTECTSFYSTNCGSIQPKYQWSWRNTLNFAGKVDVSLLWRHIGAEAQEPADVIASGPAFSGTLGSGVGALSGQTVNFGKIPAYDYFDMSVRFNVNDHLTLTGTVSNLMDKAPPIVGASIGSTSFDSGNTYPSTYDALGRRFAVTARIKL